MADIKKYLDDIMKAVYGEQVRGSIHDAIDAINTFTEEGKVEQDEAITEGLKDILIDLKTELKKMEDNLIKAGIRQFAVVDTLPSPAEASDGVIYFYFNQDTQHYDMYAKIKGTLELIDDTTIDTTGFVTKEEIEPLRTKLDGISEGAQVNTIESISLNGTKVEPDEAKNVEIKAYNEDNKPEVGGRNLLLNSGVPLTNSEYPTKSYTISDKTLKDGEKVTVTLKGTLGSGKRAFFVYNTDGKHLLFELSDKGNGYYQATGSWVHSEIGNHSIQVYPFDIEVQAESTIEWIKLERGEIATDWTPAPEDLEAEIPTKTSELTNDSGFITPNDIPEGAAASNTVPKAPAATGSVGSEMAFARGDHVHPYGSRIADSSTDRPYSTGIQFAYSGNVDEQLSTNVYPIVAGVPKIGGAPMFGAITKGFYKQKIGYAEISDITDSNFSGVLPIEKGGTGNDKGYIPMIQLGNDPSEIEKYNPKTGIYNIEDASISNVESTTYSRVIVLGDHLQIPSGYATEIIFPYSGGLVRNPMIRTSTINTWQAPRKLAFVDDIPIDEQKILAQIANRTYQGTDLTVKFKSEIDGNFSGNPWAWIQDRINNANWDGLHVCDYIPFTTAGLETDVTMQAQIAGIDTYYQYSDSLIPHHIDFITREIWPTLHAFNPVNYNNGTATQNSPWLASDMYLWLNSLSGSVLNEATVNPETIKVDYIQDGVYYFLPEELKAVIIEKRFLLETRYNASSLLTTSPGWDWQNEGKLWLPTEMEVYGTNIWGGAGYPTGGGIQYPIFANSMNRLKYRNSNRDFWWLSTPCSESSANWCHVDYRGYANGTRAATTWFGAPVCFRIASNVEPSDMPIEGPEMIDEYIQQEMEE